MVRKVPYKPHRPGLEAKRSGNQCIQTCIRVQHKSNGFFFQTEILIKMAKKGYLFAEVPYRLGLRSTDVSKAVSFPSLLLVVRGYLDLVKDIYFDKNSRKDIGKFSCDSQSAKRHKQSPRIE